MAATPAMLDHASAARFGPVTLAPGVRPRHVGSFVVAALVAISRTVLVNVLQPYVLTEHLGIAPGAQGRVSSALVAALGLRAPRPSPRRRCRAS